MTSARDVMDSRPLTVAPELSVRELASLLLQQGADGACVVDGGALRGVVTAMDLVFQQKKVHLPTVLTFMEAVIPMDLGRTRHEVEKMLGARVADIMSPHPVTVTPGADLSDVATLMVERHITLVPVLEGERLVGAITKASVLRSAFAQSGA